jgi:hypothetical protein
MEPVTVRAAPQKVIFMAEAAIVPQPDRLQTAVRTADQPVVSTRRAIPKLAQAAILFAAAAAWLWWLAGNRLTLVNDEGIFLDGAVRVLHGAVPYRDFFALIGPGEFWNLALLFRIFGVKLWAARLLLVADVALIAACMYWLLATLDSARLAAWICAFYLAVLSADSGVLVVNHQWDSGALILLAVCFFFHGQRGGGRWANAAAGATAAYAAWITPPVLVVAAVLFTWALIRREWRAALLLSAGAGSVSAVSIGLLAGAGALGPFLDHLLWTASNYAGANRFPYGEIIGGYSELLAGTHGLGWLQRAFVVAFVALPAIVPIGVLAGCAVSRRFRQPPDLLLPLCAIAGVIACAPRLDVSHMNYAAPLCYVVAGCAFAGIASRRAEVAIGLLLSIGAAAFAGAAGASRVALETIETRVGPVSANPAGARLVRDLDREVRPGERLFAFPYLPIAYFLTLARNPTVYSYLQPGMMAESDERAALQELMAAPPDKVFYQDVTPAGYLRLFPSSDPKRLRMSRIEEWLRQNYERDYAFSEAQRGYRLLEPRRSAASR